jgi:hypothetical protein
MCTLSPQKETGLHQEEQFSHLHTNQAAREHFIKEVSIPVEKSSIPGRTIFRTILSHFVFPSTGQLSESISSSFKGQRENFYHPATNEINFKEIIPSL